MDIPTGFFSKLRGLALTLEKEVKQLDQALRGEISDSDDESPVTVLHDLRGEVQTLKEAVSASLDSSCSKRKEVHDFMKASEILMQRNAADLGKIRELFQKYGYKAHVKDSTEEEEEVTNEPTVSVQNKSDEEKVKDTLNLPTSTEKPLLPKNQLCKPQLSDFGLSQYAFSRQPLSAGKTQHPTSAQRQKSKNETPLRIQTPRSLPKTPKCRLKMDDYECVTPKFEHFGITEHTMCMNEDYTISLIHKTQTMNKSVKRNDNGGNVPDMTPKRTMVTSVPKSNVRAKNADWMASPMGFMFCTPNKKVSSQKNSKGLLRSEAKKLSLPSHTVTPQHPNFQTRSSEAKKLSLPSHTVTQQHPDFQTRSSQAKELPLPSHTVTSQHPNFQTRSPEKKKLPLARPTATPPFPDFQTRWLKPEAKEQVKLGGETELVTKNGAKAKKYKESSIPFAVSPNEDPKHLEDPSPPTIEHCDQLLNTLPPPPEITRIPDDVLQILSKYNHKVDFSKEMETKAGNATRYESDSNDCCNKENRGYHGVFKPNI
ncbi:spindle and kinetochore-associated protein 3 isoform X2 [Pithys albifrons albifrons]|uniref:spindle and kinetochore-associated protein 3 isoform X2 n=1 Tax=Pithys albifrons albifrons TaxID=3385563 RepID=UPI003A5D1C8F